MTVICTHVHKRQREHFPSDTLDVGQINMDAANTSEQQIGDSLRRKIDEALAKCSYGLVILSKDFFRKEWPQKELDGLVAREDGSQKRILPVWHNVSRSDVAAFSPILADRIGVSTSSGLENVVNEILRAIEVGQLSTTATTPSAPAYPTETSAACASSGNWALLHTHFFLHDSPALGRCSSLVR